MAEECRQNKNQQPGQTYRQNAKVSVLAATEGEGQDTGWEYGE